MGAAHSFGLGDCCACACPPGEQPAQSDSDLTSAGGEAMAVVRSHWCVGFSGLAVDVNTTTKQTLPVMWSDGSREDFLPRLRRGRKNGIHLQGQLQKLRWGWIDQPPMLELPRHRQTRPLNVCIISSPRRTIYCQANSKVPSLLEPSASMDKPDPQFDNQPRPLTEASSQSGAMASAPLLLPKDIAVEEFNWFVGPRAESYKKNENTFSWAALLFSILWLAYRKMYLNALVGLFVFWSIALFACLRNSSAPVDVLDVIFVVSIALLGWQGNRLYRNHVFDRVRAIRATTTNQQAYLENSVRSGGTSLASAVLTGFVGILGLVQLAYMLPDKNAAQPQPLVTPEGSRYLELTQQYWGNLLELEKVANLVKTTDMSTMDSSNYERISGEWRAAASNYSAIADRVRGMPALNVGPDLADHALRYAARLKRVSELCTSLARYVDLRKQFDDNYTGFTPLLESFIRGLMLDPLGKARELKSDAARLDFVWSELQKQAKDLDAEGERMNALKAEVRQRLSQKYGVQF